MHGLACAPPAIAAACVRAALRRAASRALAAHAKRRFRGFPRPPSFPPVVGTLAVLLSGVSVPVPAVPAALARALPALAAAVPASVTGAAVVVPALALYYVQLTARAGLPLVGLGAGACVVALWRGAEAFIAARGGFANAWRPALALHVVAWVMQFVGHGVFEGRAPALLDNLFDALVMAPLFVFIEATFWLGGLAGFRRASQVEVDKRRAAFIAAKAGSGGGAK